MPVAQSGMYRCQTCGYKEFRTFSDAFTGKDAFKPCPKCGGMMVKMKDEEKNILDVAREGVGKVLDFGNN